MDHEYDETGANLIFIVVIAVCLTLGSLATLAAQMIWSLA